MPDYMAADCIRWGYEPAYSNLSFVNAAMDYEMEGETGREAHGYWPPPGSKHVLLPRIRD